MAQMMKERRDEEIKDINSCYFDSRIDSTLIPKKINGAVVNEEDKEEHYALVKEPGRVSCGTVRHPLLLKD